MRLYGVDALELDSKVGRDAKGWMINYLSGKTVSCDLIGSAHVIDGLGFATQILKK